ncbi:MAG: primosomal protein N', partial [Alcanivoracaceae bacterium]|nr:primosomal protein N' [Alcanivoracaceae bacterium]
QGWLLDGVTGSGKTEVFLALARRALAAGRQVLLLVPEIGLVPQMVARAQVQIDGRIVVLHSELAEGERLLAHRAVADGLADLVVGTRSALWAPLPRLGLIIVDEEHDAAYKQQEGVRYHARDMALVRARELAIPVMLGSATPSLESLANVERGRLRRSRLNLRVGGAPKPRWWVEDLSQAPAKSVVGQHAIKLIGEQLAQGQQVLVFRNRRGYAPVLICRDCGWQAQCRDCDARLVIHRGQGRIRCHHCGWSAPTPASCPECASLALFPLGVGTERVEDALTAAFPETPILRFDRDTVARKGAREAGLATLREGGAAIIIGTQMLAKGHHFPNLALAIILDADGGFLSADFRGPEHASQLILQVAGRTGRAQHRGTVIIQSRHPEHAMLHTLLSGDYHQISRQLLNERRITGLPPCGHLAMFRSESLKAADSQQLLDDLASVAVDPRVQILGPIPAPLERRQGRFRFQLLLRADHRAPLHGAIEQLLATLESHPLARRCRWHLDVDPLDML